MSEALADESSQFSWVVQRINAGNYTAGTVAEHEHRQSGLALLNKGDERRGVGDIVCKLLHVETLAV